jgi:hypothetical protein
MKLSVNPLKWETQYSDVQVKIGLTGFKLFVPKNGSLNYVVTQAPDVDLNKFIGLNGKFLVKAVNATYKTYNTSYPPNFRLYLQQKGDNWKSNGYRWWSTAVSGYSFLPLNGKYIIGLHTIFAPVYWQGIDGKSAMTNPERFKAALKSPDKIGITFGGSYGNDFGHGVELLGGKCKIIGKEFELV